MGDVRPQNSSNMEPLADRRREPRYPIGASVALKKNNGEIIRATALDISSSGMRLEIEQLPCPIALDEEITIEIELPEYPDKPFSMWGVGRVAHIGAGKAGIQLRAGHFDPLPSYEGAD